MLFDPARLLLIAGPCSLEGEAVCRAVADVLRRLAAAHPELNVVFKGSFDKANRTSLAGGRGTGLEEGLRLLALVRREYGFPVLTDIHERPQAAPVAEVCDVLQIPAFLCRQTDLLVAAARTGRVVNVKKGQFLAPWDMAHVAAKITGSGNPNVLLTERGASFGYNTLVTDFRGLPVMAEVAPVIFDATHSVQQPGGQGGSSGGQREFVPVLARAAVAVGVAGVFIETHEDPDRAPSDGPNMVALRDLPQLLATLKAFDDLRKSPG